MAADTPETWGRDFDPDRLAVLELRMWKAYYRGQRLRLFALLIQANREQARVGWLRALLAAFWLAWAAVRFARSTGDYDRFAPAIARGYRTLGLPSHVHPREVAHRELRWWVVRREMGLTSSEAAGDAIAALYAALYAVPVDRVAEAGRLRGQAAEVRDRGAATPSPDGRGYWLRVHALLRESYRSLHRALATPSMDEPADRSTA